MHRPIVPSHKARCRCTAWRFGSYPAIKALSARQAHTTGHTHSMWRSPFLYSLPISCPFVSASNSLFSQRGWDIPKGREQSLPSRGTAATGTTAPCRKEEACTQPFCRKAAFPGKAWKEIRGRARSSHHKSMQECRGSCLPWGNGIPRQHGSLPGDQLPELPEEGDTQNTPCFGFIFQEERGWEGVWGGFPLLPSS